MASGSSTVVDGLIAYPEIKGSNPAAAWHWE
jgi:hypothetical protein